MASARWCRSPASRVPSGPEASTPASSSSGGRSSCPRPRALRNRSAPLASPCWPARRSRPATAAPSTRLHWPRNRTSGRFKAAARSRLANSAALKGRSPSTACHSKLNIRVKSRPAPPPAGAPLPRLLAGAAKARARIASRWPWRRPLGSSIAKPASASRAERWVTSCTNPASSSSNEAGACCSSRGASSGARRVSRPSWPNTASKALAAKGLSPAQKASKGTSKLGSAAGRSSSSTSQRRRRASGGSWQRRQSCNSPLAATPWRTQAATPCSRAVSASAVGAEAVVGLGVLAAVGSVVLASRESSLAKAVSQASGRPKLRSDGLEPLRAPCKSRCRTQRSTAAARASANWRWLARSSAGSMASNQGRSAAAGSGHQRARSCPFRSLSNAGTTRPASTSTTAICSQRCSKKGSVCGCAGITPPPPTSPPAAGP